MHASEYHEVNYLLFQGSTNIIPTSNSIMFSLDQFWAIYENKLILKGGRQPLEGIKRVVPKCPNGSMLLI